jgi:hypothetical protein
VLNLLRTSTTDEKNWVKQVPNVLLAYRASVHSSLGASPSLALFGREPRLPVDFKFPTKLKTVGQKHNQRASIRDTLKLAAEERARQYDKRNAVIPRSFALGDRVYWSAVRGTKLGPVWSGPFVVQAQVGDTNYVIKGTGSVTKEVHINQLKACHNPATLLGTLRGRGRPRKV